MKLVMLDCSPPPVKFGSLKAGDTFTLDYPIVADSVVYMVLSPVFETRDGISCSGAGSVWNAVTLTGLHLGKVQIIQREERVYPVVCELHL